MQEFIPAAPGKTVLSVSELNQKVRKILEQQFATVWVEGEISNFASPSSGHWYFSLKDSGAQIRAAMFRNSNRRVNFRPKEGMQVLVRGKLSLYEPRGDYQLIVDTMEEAGEGALRRAFEQLKAQLEKEGLFDDQYKQELPYWPSKIGVITSPTGAAIKDILHVLERRFPAIPVVIYPVAVQGEEAAPQITAAIATANRRRDADVLIVGRGGGSLEDLWAFNEEIVARAIFDSALPIISAVGHQTDFTIADFVADLRAPTPSAAAELASPDQQEWLDSLASYESILTRHLTRKLNDLSQQLDFLQRRLKHPGKELQEQRQRLQQLLTRLIKSNTRQQQTQFQQLHFLNQRLLQNRPDKMIQQLRLRLAPLKKNLNRAMTDHLQLSNQHWHHLGQRLDTVSPLATLNRGYSITRNQQKEVIKDCNRVKKGELINTMVSNGEIISKVVDIQADLEKN